MDKKIKTYINEVLSYIHTDKLTKKRLNEDLMTTILEKSRYVKVEDVLKEMGDPKQIAKEFMVEHGIDDQTYVDYRSKTRLFGLPLIHVRFSKRKELSNNVAKGIIAIGPVAVGIISIGAFPIGFISIGAIGIGLITLASISFGLLLAVGAIAVGMGAIGAVAIGYIARGAVAIGHTAIGVKALGNHVLEGENFKDYYVLQFIKLHHPKLADWIIKLFS